MSISVYCRPGKKPALTEAGETKRQCNVKLPNLMHLGLQFVWTVGRLCGAEREREGDGGTQWWRFLHHTFINSSWTEARLENIQQKHSDAPAGHWITDAGIIYLFPGEALGSLDFLREDLNGTKGRVRKRSLTEEKMWTDVNQYLCTKWFLWIHSAEQWM